VNPKLQAFCKCLHGGRCELHSMLQMQGSMLPAVVDDARRSCKCSATQRSAGKEDSPHFDFLECRCEQGTLEEKMLELRRAKRAEPLAGARDAPGAEQRAQSPDLGPGSRPAAAARDAEPQGGVTRSFEGLREMLRSLHFVKVCCTRLELHLAACLLGHPDRAAPVVSLYCSMATSFPARDSLSLLSALMYSLLRLHCLISAMMYSQLCAHCLSSILMQSLLLC
jgi:hypothetical protein